MNINIVIIFSCFFFFTIHSSYCHASELLFLSGRSGFNEAVSWGSKNNPMKCFKRLLSAAAPSCQEQVFYSFLYQFSSWPVVCLHEIKVLIQTSWGPKDIINPSVRNVAPPHAPPVVWTTNKEPWILTIVYAAGL